MKLFKTQISTQAENHKQKENVAADKKLIFGKINFKVSET